MMSDTVNLMLIWCLGLALGGFFFRRSLVNGTKKYPFSASGVVVIKQFAGAYDSNYRRLLLSCKS